jgi:glyoxylase-like metal-dependent hydrolase (beta-lactamase superfamily II)
MNLHVIETGQFKLDGGAMFGVVPKSIWQKTNPADENNLCTWAMRCLLIEYDNRRILIDTGIGDKQNEKFFSHYFLSGDNGIVSNLNKKGISENDITDVVLTHLHFDHCGGAIKYNTAKTYFEPTFKNATYWSHSKHWDWATKPNEREKASFLKENIMPIEESGQLQFVDKASIGAFMSFEHSYGHTESMIHPIIEYKGKKIIYMADLLPSIGHIPLPYIMGYDTRPLLTLEDRKRIFSRLEQEKMVLFLEHDSINECCTLQNTEKGIRLDKTFNLSEL